MLRLGKTVAFILLCLRLTVLYDLLPAAFAEHELEGRVAIQRISVALQ